MRLILIVLFINTPFCYAQISLYHQMDSLANVIGLEYVSFDKLPEINSSGSYGSTYVLDFLPKSNPDFKNTKSILFLARKINSMGLNTIDNEQPLDPYWDYDYALVFGTKNLGDSNFTIRDVINRNIGPNGMALYHLDLDLKLNVFNRVDNPSINGNSNSYINDYYGSIPIMISTEEATKFLYYYNDYWYEYVEVTH